MNSRWRYEEVTLVLAHETLNGSLLCWGVEMEVALGVVMKGRVDLKHLVKSQRVARAIELAKGIRHHGMFLFGEERWLEVR
jgi:hypothetical protein